MAYHIDTGLIKEKFKVDCECPLCEIQKIVEEQFLHEFLNDAVMEDNTRIKVGRNGFCAKHFDMMFSRPNKLSVALQIQTRVNLLEKYFEHFKSASKAKKMAKEIEKSQDSCVICSLVQESMVKYYKTIAQMFEREKDFFKTLLSTKGFCFHHYAQLLKYSNHAGFLKNDYVSVISGVQERNLKRLKDELKTFCDSHDYRNAGKPLGSAETALPRMREKFYGKKYQ